MRPRVLPVGSRIKQQGPAACRTDYNPTFHPPKKGTWQDARLAACQRRSWRWGCWMGTDAVVTGKVALGGAPLSMLATIDSN
eukprot:4417008-Amphidinium_carterae.1